MKSDAIMIKSEDNVATVLRDLQNIERREAIRLGIKQWKKRAC